MKIRASIGTAVLLGLEQATVMEKPTTAYLMLYSETHCSSNCMFCPQARESRSKTNQLSRVLWPTFNLQEIVNAFSENPKVFERVCFQTVKFTDSTKKLFEILKTFQDANISIPISVCSYPLSQEQFQKIKKLGVERIGISFDCAKPKIFDAIKGNKRGTNISWIKMEKTLQKAIKVFGKENTSTHLIIGLGESEEEAVNFIQKFHNKGITIGLFAFTPVKGTEMEDFPQPSIDSYRRIQLAHYLIRKNLVIKNKMKFDKTTQEIKHFGLERTKILEIIEKGTPFITTGCKGCNRPYYNERPGSEFYNFPRMPNHQEIETITSSFLNLKDQ